MSLMRLSEGDCQIESVIHRQPEPSSRSSTRQGLSDVSEQLAPQKESCTLWCLPIYNHISTGTLRSLSGNLRAFMSQQAERTRWQQLRASFSSIFSSPSVADADASMPASSIAPHNRTPTDLAVVRSRQMLVAFPSTERDEQPKSSAAPADHSPVKNRRKKSRVGVYPSSDLSDTGSDSSVDPDLTTNFSSLLACFTATSVSNGRRRHIQSHYSSTDDITRSTYSAHEASTSCSSVLSPPRDPDMPNRPSASPSCSMPSSCASSLSPSPDPQVMRRSIDGFTPKSPKKRNASYALDRRSDYDTVEPESPKSSRSASCATSRNSSPPPSSRTRFAATVRAAIVPFSHHAPTTDAQPAPEPLIAPTPVAAPNRHSTLAAILRAEEYLAATSASAVEPSPPAQSQGEMEVDLKSDFSELSIEVPPSSDVSAFRIPSVVDALRRRELCGGTRRVAASSAAFCSVRAPLSLSQVSTASSALLEGEFDKAFSALWWDSDHVLLGTKNAKLGLWNTRTSDIVQVTDSAVTSSNGVYVLQRSPDSLWVAANSRSSVAELSLWRSADIEQTKELRQPTAPVATFQGHTDSIFGATWVDPSCLVTASRDGSLGIWRPPADFIESAEHLCISPAVLQTQAHLGHKVRAVTADPQFQTRCASLAVDASVAIWDLNRAGSSSAALLRARLTEESTGSNQPESSEVAAMCWNARHDFLSVGTRTHIVMIDARSAALIGSVPSVDEGWGVKSLSTFDHLVTVGGGLGRLSFFDVRKCEYLALPNHDQESTIYRQCHGALRDSPVRAEYARRRLPTLCGLMAHAWDASRSRLLVAGGPLFADLSGIYAAVWN